MESPHISPPTHLAQIPPQDYTSFVTTFLTEYFEGVQEFRSSGVQNETPCLSVPSVVETSFQFSVVSFQHNKICVICVICGQTPWSPTNIPNSSFVIRNSLFYVWGPDISGTMQGAGGVGVGVWGRISTYDISLVDHLA